MHTTLKICSTVVGMFVSAAALSCAGPAADDGSDITVTTRAIQNGWNDFDNPGQNATVFVQMSGGCTGTLVRSDLVLTAAHCLGNTPSNGHLPEGIETGATYAGQIMVATTSSELWTHELGPVFERPWTSVGVNAELRTITGVDDLLYASNTSDRLLVRAIDGPAGSWADIGPTPAGLIALAASATELVGITAADQFYRRPRTGAAPAWTWSGIAGGAIALAVDDQGRIYGATAAGRLRLRQTFWTWQDIGGADAVRGLDYHDGFLYGVTDTRLLARRAVPWDVVWQDRGPAASPRDIGVAKGQIVRLRNDGWMYRRETALAWKKIGSTPARMNGLAVSGSDLFGLDTARRLWVRPAADAMAAWSAVDTHLLPVTSMTSHGGYLYILTSAGIFRRPAARTVTPWESVASNAATLKLVELTAHAGFLYGHSGDSNRLYRRHAHGDWEAFVEVSPGAGCLAMAGDGSTIYCVNNRGHLFQRAISAPAAEGFRALPRLDWERPDVLNTLSGRVSVGADRVAPRATHTVTGYFHGTEVDAVVLKLATPVDAANAIPVPPLTATPSSDPTAFWEAQSFDYAGWGFMVPNPDKLFRKDAATFTELGGVPGPIDMEIHDGTVHMLGADGRVLTKRLDALDGVSATVSTKLDLVGIGVRDTGELFGATRSEVFRFNATARTWESLGAVALLTSGEEVTSTAVTGSNLYVSTTNSRLYRRSLTTGSWADLGEFPYSISLTAWGGDILSLTASRQIYSWPDLFLGEASGMSAIAYYNWEIYTASPGIPRYRQAGIGSGETYPFGGTLRSILVAGNRIRQGDSGGPLYWTHPSTGARHVVGVTQQENGAGGRFTVTFCPSVIEDGLPMPNMGGWLRFITSSAP